MQTSIRGASRTRTAHDPDHRAEFDGCTQVSSDPERFIFGGDAVRMGNHNNTSTRDVPGKDHPPCRGGENFGSRQDLEINSPVPWGIRRRGSVEVVDDADRSGQWWSVLARH